MIVVYAIISFFHIIQEKKLIFFKFDDLVKSQKIPFPVIPAKAGIQCFQAVADHLDSGFHRIQCFQAVADHLDSGFHRSDDFLRIHQI
jgi:hypothetical protein